jgi:hypothetical protein
MALYSPYASGLGNSAAYQVAGKPFMTGSFVGNGGEVRVQFPTVAKSIIIVNTGSAGNADALKLSLVSTSDGLQGGAIGGLHLMPVFASNTNYDQSACTVKLEGKFKEIYVSDGTTSQTSMGGFYLYAELTGIPSADMYELTGSGVNTHGVG